jgi:hypothetical protein
MKELAPIGYNGVAKAIVGSTRTWKYYKSCELWKQLIASLISG